MFWKFAWFELNPLCMKEDRGRIQKKFKFCASIYLKTETWGKEEGLKR